MANTYFEDHPTDPNKVILRKRPCPFCQDKPRTWQGLTDDEVSKLIDNEIGFNSCCGWEEEYTRAVEAKLKEKNHDSR